MMKRNGSNPAGIPSEASGKPAWRRSRLWRAGRVCLLGVLTLLTLLVLYTLQENWRGKRAWRNYKAKMEAQGAVFELAKLAPPPVPDDQNFAMTPLLKPLLDLYPPGTTNRNRFRDPEGLDRVKAIVVNDPEIDRQSSYYADSGEASTNQVTRPERADWRLGERISLQQWQRYYRHSKVFPSWPQPHTPAEDVLKALSRYDAELAELSAATHRPYARFDVQYDEPNPAGIILAHLGVLREIAKVVRLKAVAELAMGDSDAAFEDVNLMLALADSIKDEPNLISHLVRLAILDVTERTIWEGLCDHRWSETQLMHFQEELGGMDLVRELRQGLLAERAFGTEIVELIIRKPELAFELGIWTSGNSDQPSSGPGVAQLIPKGWLYFEVLHSDQALDRYFLNVLPDNAGDLNVEQVRQASQEFERRMAGLSPFKAFLQHRLFCKVLLPALDMAPPRFVRAEALKDMAIIAMALERYRLTQHDYPASLEALAPKYVGELPKDPVTHQAFRYARNDDASFRLWSVGWNGIDDGGVVLYEVHGGERSFAGEQLDWVWPSVQGMRFKEVSD